MASWFQCNIKYQKEQENGSLKTITEQYLIDAVSYTDAEVRIYQELSSIMKEFRITNIGPAKLTDVFHYDDAEVWYKCKVVYVSLDEKSGKEKKINNFMVVSAANLKQAYERIEESLKTMLAPFDIDQITKTGILEVFPYVSPDPVLLPELSKHKAETQPDTISE